MLSRNHPDRIQITFDDRRLVANAGLLLPATLARHLGLPELVRQRLDLGDAPGRANTSDKMMTLVASALAGGDCIDDADVLRRSVRRPRGPAGRPRSASRGQSAQVRAIRPYKICCVVKEEQFRPIARPQHLGERRICTAWFAAPHRPQSASVEIADATEGGVLPGADGPECGPCCTWEPWWRHAETQSFDSSTSGFWRLESLRNWLSPPVCGSC